MKAALKAIVPALALTAALALPSLAEAGHRHGRGCGHKGYHSKGYGRSGYYNGGYRGHGGYGGNGGYYTAPYGYAYAAPYRPYARPYYAAPPPYGYGYGYYPPPPPPVYHGGPRFGLSLHFGF
ncbi:MAG TPA: hypothetical protein VIJ10_14775 [Vicinamibacteria bacterium]